MSRPLTVAASSAALLVLIQLIPVKRINPAVETEVPATPTVRQVLRRACYDCHSHETRWPRYAYVAPISWLVAYDVHEAREHLNFSTWNRYDPGKQQELLEEIWEEVEEDEMPLWIYRPLHPDAELSDADRQMIRHWTSGRAVDVPAFK